jgi:diguanylate cyclase (GGDEF)-like protein
MIRLFALAALAVGLGASAPETEPGEAPRATVTVLATQPLGNTTVYRLRVTEGPRTVLVMLPYGVENATLEVNGIAREREGPFVPVGNAPLGHGIDTLPLRGLGPNDRVVVRVTGSNQDISFAYDTELLADVHTRAIFSGMYYATLVTIALFEIVALIALHDPTLLWYLGYTVVLIFREMTRDGRLSASQGVDLELLLAFNLVGALLTFGFSLSFLRLRRDSPRLYRITLLFVGLPLVAAGIFSFLTHPSGDNEALLAATLAGLVTIIVVAVIRRRAGYAPATLLVFALIGITLVLAQRLITDVMGVYVPFMNRWGLEFGSTCNVLAFSVGIVVRARFVSTERARLQSDVSAATNAAMHDQLTGLLNRRGFESRFAALSIVAGTVLFIDVDGFKRVNDLGGHAAGDAALTNIAQILTASVRSHDIVARIGGDEFVVLLNGSMEAPDLERVIARIVDAVGSMRPLGPDNSLRIGLSVGPALLAPGQDISSAIAAADIEAYRIKAEHYAASALRSRPEADTAR